MPLFLYVLFLFGIPVPAEGEWWLDLEGGWAWCGYNDVRIPGDTGTPFSLTEDLAAESTPVFRLRLGYRFHPKHSVSVLLAPLSTDAEGFNAQDIFFNGENFARSSDLRGFYKFNSYRLTYRFDFVNSEKWRVGLGLTAKIRDAEIRLNDGEKSTAKTDLGFVPLLHFLVEWTFSAKWSLLFEGDALASPGGQGRAEDVLLALTYHLKDTVDLKAGYRLLEGGADVQEVYNFALFHYAVAGVLIRF